jgi:hypothetical protein
MQKPSKHSGFVKLMGRKLTIFPRLSALAVKALPPSE